MAALHPGFLKLACFVRALFLVLRLDRMEQITGEEIKAAVAQGAADIGKILGASKRLMIANLANVDDATARGFNDDILAWVREQQPAVVHRQLLEAHRRNGASVKDRREPAPQAPPPAQAQGDPRQPAAARQPVGPRVELVVPAKVTIQEGATKTISAQVALKGLPEKTRVNKVYLVVSGNFGGELSKTQGDDAFDAHSHTSEAQITIPADFEGSATVQAWVRIPGTTEPITSGSFKMEIARVRAAKPVPAAPPAPLSLSGLTLALRGPQKLELAQGAVSQVKFVAILHGKLPAGIDLGALRAGLALDGQVCHLGGRFDLTSQAVELAVAIPADYEGVFRIQAYAGMPSLEPLWSEEVVLTVTRTKAAPSPVSAPLLLASALQLVIAGQQEITLEGGEESAMALIVALHGTLPAGMALSDLTMVLYDRAGVAHQGRFDPVTRTVAVRINIGADEEGTYTFRACASTSRAADVLWADPFEVTLVRNLLELEPDPEEPPTDFSRAGLRLNLPERLTAVRGSPAQVMVHVSYVGPRPAGGYTTLPMVVVRAGNLSLPISDVELRFQEDNPRTYGQIEVPEGVEGEISFVAELFGHLVESEAATVDLSWRHPPMPRRGRDPEPEVIDVPMEDDPDPVPVVPGLPERVRVTISRNPNDWDDADATVRMELRVEGLGRTPLEDDATFPAHVQMMEWTKPFLRQEQWQPVKGQSRTMQVPGEIVIAHTEDRSVSVTLPDYPDIVITPEEIELGAWPIVKESRLSKGRRIGAGVRGILGSLVEQGAPPPRRPNPTVQRARGFVRGLLETTPEGAAQLEDMRTREAQARVRHAQAEAAAKAAAAKAEAEAKKPKPEQPPKS